MIEPALRQDALACHAAALAAVAPGRCLATCVTRSGGRLVLAGAAGRRVDEHTGPVVIVGAGKAALAMGHAAAEIVGADLRGGLVVAPHGSTGTCHGSLAVATGAHPVPDAAGEAATARLLARVADADAGTLVLVVLSGGASALLVAPADGLTLADKQDVTARLLGAGADITALNTVRKHCSRVKGGGLVRAAAGAGALWALVLSDVVGDDPATIASGPSVADPTTYADAVAVLSRYLPPDAAPAVRGHLVRGERGGVPETLKPGDPLLARTRTVIVGGNHDAVRAAAAAATARGYAVEVLASPLTGDATVAGRILAARLRAAPRARRVALIAGGETTVRVEPGGRGGRCQQLALAAALALTGTPAVLLAAGTDGVDGPSGAAGACVDGETATRAAAGGLDPARALTATDSAPVLAATGDLLVTGPTGTNVADVVVALRAAW